MYWRNEGYWRLPENVRNAIDIAKMKSKHSEFWYKLEILNDKIFIFRSMFYSRMPAFQKAFLDKKRKILEARLKQQKEAAEREMNRNMNMTRCRKKKLANK